MNLERDTVLAAIREAQGNISEAAKILGCSRRTLQNRMRAYGIPEGRSGRRKRSLPYRRKRAGLGYGAAALALVGGVLIGRKLTKGSSNA